MLNILITLCSKSVIISLYKGLLLNNKQNLLITYHVLITVLGAVVKYFIEYMLDVQLIALHV